MQWPQFPTNALVHRPVVIGMITGDAIKVCRVAGMQ
jgi:hypothetical protein